jgi:phospholipid/cholesterol/gamma-HCH transport system ATP-binding protein
VVVTHDMNSVMSIGEYIMFLYKGNKLWEGNSETITRTQVKELNDFVFASKLLRDMQGKQPE